MGSRCYHFLRIFLLLLMGTFGCLKWYRWEVVCSSFYTWETFVVQFYFSVLIFYFFLEFSFLPVVFFFLVQKIFMMWGLALRNCEGQCDSMPFRYRLAVWHSDIHVFMCLHCSCVLLLIQWTTGSSICIGAMLCWNIIRFSFVKRLGTLIKYLC